MKEIFLAIVIVIFASGSLFGGIVPSEYQYGSNEVRISSDYYSKGLIKKAETDLLEIIDIFPENASRDKALLLLADIDIKSGNFNVAKGNLSDFIKERQNSPFRAFAALKRAFISFEIGDWRTAEYDFKITSEIAQTDFQIRNQIVYKEIECTAIYWQAISLIHQGRLTDAESIFILCPENCINSKFADDALFALGMLKEIEKKYEDAIVYYNRLVREFPNTNYSFISRIHAANCQLILKQPAIAMLTLEQLESEIAKSISIDTTAPNYEKQELTESLRQRVHYLKGEAANIGGNYKKAVTELESFIDTYSDSPMENAVRLSLGFALLNLKKYQEALDYYNEVIASEDESKDGEKERAMLYRTVTLKRLGQAELARKELMALAALPSYPYSGGALLELGQLYYEIQDYQSARKTLERAKREASNPLEKERIILLLASTYTQLKLWDNAASEYENAKKAAKASDKLTMTDKDLYIAESSLGRGIALVQSKRGNEAIAELHEFLAGGYSKNREDLALFWLAEANYSSNLFENAIKNYRRVVDSYPASTRREEALYSLGWCYFKTKQFAQSTTTFDQLTREFPKSKFLSEVWVRQGDAYYVQKKYDYAATAYQKASQIAPGTEDGQYAAFQLCDALYRQNKLEDAVTALLNFVERYQKSNYAPNSLYLIGWIRFQQARYQEAIDNFNFMIASYPQSTLTPRAHYAIADAYYNSGSYEKAIESYRFVAEKYPSNPLAPEAMKGVQYSLVALGRDEEAVQVLDNYVSQNLESPFIQDFKMKKGELLLSQGRFKDAVLEYDNFLKQHPNADKSAEALFYMAKSYDKMNESDEAIKIFSRLQTTYPNSEFAADALLEAGLIRKNQTKTQSADSIFKILEQSYPENEKSAAASFERAEIAYDMGDSLVAVNLYKSVAQKWHPNEYSIKSRFKLAMYYYNKNQLDSSIYQLSFLTNLADDPYLSAEAQYRVAKMLMEKNNLQAAAEAFIKLTDRFPGVDDWYSYGMLHLGEVYQKLNMSEQALVVYKALIDWRGDDDFGNTALERVKRIESQIIPLKKEK